MGRGGRLALAGGGCLVVLALVAYLAWPRDETSRTTVGDAVRSFRSEAAEARQREGTGEPAPGVYRYGTRGSESVDSPVLNTTHDYNGVSTIVISAGRCSERERWQVLDARWTEGELCPGAGGETNGTVVEFHEFFGTAQKDVFHCRGEDLPLRAGAESESSCSSDDSSISTVSRVLAVEKVRVGAATYDAAVIRSRSEFGGANSGTAVRREWRRRSDGLLLRRAVDSDAKTSTPAGSAHYTERYSIRLLSTTPKR